MDHIDLTQSDCDSDGYDSEDELKEDIAGNTTLQIRAAANYAEAMEGMRAPDGKRSHRWVFTVFNMDFDPRQLEASGRAVYCMWQREKSPSTGRHHFQGFICFQYAVGFTGVRKLFPRQSHIEMMRGTIKANKKYCGKELTRVDGPWEFGTEPSEQGGGRGGRLESFAEGLKSGAKVKDLAMIDPATFIRNYRGIQVFSHMLATSNYVKPQLHICWGPSGTGKSTWAVPDKRWPTWGFKTEIPNEERFGRITNDPASQTLWFDKSYAGQEIVILEDVDPDWNLSVSWFKKIISPVQGTVAIKGETAPFNSKHILVTSNYHWTKWFKVLRGEDKEAFERRITTLTKLTNVHVYED